MAFLGALLCLSGMGVFAMIITIAITDLLDEEEEEDDEDE